MIKREAIKQKIREEESNYQGLHSDISELKTLVMFMGKEKDKLNFEI